MAKTKVTQTLILRVTYEIEDGNDYDRGSERRGRLGFFKGPIERLLNKPWNEKLKNIKWEVEHVSPLVEERVDG